MKHKKIPSRHKWYLFVPISRITRSCSSIFSSVHTVVALVALFFLYTELQSIYPITEQGIHVKLVFVGWEKENFFRKYKFQHPSQMSEHLKEENPVKSNSKATSINLRRRTCRLTHFLGSG